MQTITIDAHFLSVNSQSSSRADPWLPRIQNNDEYLQLGLTFAPREGNTGNCDTSCNNRDVVHADGGDTTPNERENFTPLGDLGAIRLASALQCNTRLLSLNLSGNNIGKTGAAALAKALYRCVDVNNQHYESRTSLQLLGLSSNQIGDDGARALGEALRYNTSLRSLDLSFNEISNNGVVELLTRGLNLNSSVKRLHLIGNVNFMSGKQTSELLQSITYVLLSGHSCVETLEIHCYAKDATSNRGSKCNDSFFGGARDEDLWKLLLAIYGTSASRYTSEPYSGLPQKQKVKNHRLRTVTLPNSTETTLPKSKGSISTNTKGGYSFWRIDRITSITTD
eukprot:CCRYP_019216-RA/>CCRYP_019216-RA protein AED:0.05 eAED:0.05 QI:69/1/1/1/0/0/2/339/337